MEQIEIITASDSNNRSSRTKTPECVLQSMLLALNEGRIFSVVGEFDDQFMFTDHALDLEFTDRPNLADFFQKSPELFPDAVVDLSAASLTTMSLDRRRINASSQSGIGEINLAACHGRQNNLDAASIDVLQHDAL